MLKDVALVLFLLVALVGQRVEAGSAAATRPTYGEMAQGAFTGRTLLRKKFRLGKKPPPRATDNKCGEWKIGTATGYSTDGTDKGDKPLAPNDLGEYVVPGKFFKARNVVAVDYSDWRRGSKYRNLEVALEGKVGTFQVWDYCNDKDCAKDNPKCCSTNKRTYSKPGYLVDVETHAAEKVWGLKRVQDYLVAPVWYRECNKFNKNKDVKRFKMKCVGEKGDGKCSK